jgi:hypothetical protein
MSEYTLQDLRKSLSHGKPEAYTFSAIRAIDAAIIREAELRAENERLREDRDCEKRLRKDARDLYEELKPRIAELEAAGAQGVPEGWRLVPVECTDAMAQAARAHYADNENYPSWGSIYGAMLAAAPSAPATAPNCGACPGDGSVCKDSCRVEGENPPVTVVPQWQPIETAPKNQTILLGRFNTHGKWRTFRGRWVEQDEIDNEWEDGEMFSEGWYETSVHAEEPNCWKCRPKHWMPLPAAPVAENAALKWDNDLSCNANRLERD